MRMNSRFITRAETFYGILPTCRVGCNTTLVNQHQFKTEVELNLPRFPYGKERNGQDTLLRGPPLIKISQNFLTVN